MIRFIFAFLFLTPYLYGAEIFRISLADTPKNLDPHGQRYSSGNFLSQQLYRHFYSLNDKNDYVPDLGETCKESDLKWTCTLKKDLKWSDGTELTANDFVQSYIRILTLPSPRANLLFNIKNAQEIFEHSKSTEELGVKALDARTFEITWNRFSVDNKLVLMSPLFVPLPLGLYKKNIFSGPYKIVEQNNQRFILSPNSFYPKKNQRPQIEFQIFEENLAVKAFMKKQLDFLRKVPTAQIPIYESRSDFHWYPILRLDSIAFGPDLHNNLELRKKLTESLNFEELQNLFHSPAKIGCPGISLSLANEICYQGSRSFPKPKDSVSLNFAYSTWGGDDHRRLAEWLQSQWLTKINIKLVLQPLENKIFQELLEKAPPSIFRKGLGFESPTCHSTLQIFTSHHPDNFIKFKNANFDTLVESLAQARKPKSQKKLCDKALKLLMDSYLLIPTGRIHFSVMVNPRWTGWKLNQLNHLDLSELTLRQ